MILGLHIGHDASACLIDETDIFAVAEERTTRIKNFHGIPVEAMELCLAQRGACWRDISAIAVAGTHLPHLAGWRLAALLEHRHEDFSNEVSWRARWDMLRASRSTGTTLGPALTNLMRRRGFDGEITFLDHHLCHVASSHITFPAKETVLISMDGGGDGINWSIYTADDDSLRLVTQTIPDANGHVHPTPADVYADTTKFLGFKRIRHEGKLTGMAARGQPLHIDYFRNLLTLRDGGFYGRTTALPRQPLHRRATFLLTGSCYDPTMINDMARSLAGARPEDVAASLQAWLEEIVPAFLDYHCRAHSLTGRPLRLSGGLFANVSLNRVIRECGMFSDVQIVPNMGDGGLALGAAALLLPTATRTARFAMPQPSVYYGPSYDGQAIDAAVRAVGWPQCSQPQDFTDTVAAALAKGRITGFFQGRMEYGPRALGARSILADPRDATINEQLNARLHRNDFMPFAPVIRDIDAPALLEGYDPSHLSAAFMTTTYRVTDRTRKLAPAVVHLDGTVRPQIIGRETNPRYYDVLTAFAAKTGTPILINTSFNAHEEPIVMSPADALNALGQGAIDLLAIEDRLVTAPTPGKDPMPC